MPLVDAPCRLTGVLTFFRAVDCGEAVGAVCLDDVVFVDVRGS